MPTRKEQKQEKIQQLYAQMEKVLQDHQKRKTNPELEQDVLKLAEWQSQRMLRTYADMFATARYFPPMNFFKEDMYAPKDFSKRDLEAKKVFPVMSRVVPAGMVGTLALVMEVNALSMALDDRLAAALKQLGAIDAITPAAYGEAYRLCDNRAEREYQIELIVKVGQAVNRYVKFPYISGALKIMHKPAHMLGLGDLQDFLERGYEGFKHMGDASEFLLQIEDREGKILDNIFAGKDDPFDIDTIPLKSPV